MKSWPDVMNIAMKQTLFIITGPTGVGKTDLALDLARKLPLEIINADSGQFYQPLTIGTAKPNWRSSPVPHHGFDMLTSPENYSVVAYRSYVQNLCESLWSEHKIPVLVGGSLFYIQSLFFPPQQVEHTNTVPETRFEITWQALHAVDPVRAQAIHPHDIYRIQRALTLWHTTAQKPSALSLPYEPFCNAHLIFLTRSADELAQRINDRVRVMFEQGFIKEVASLKNTEWETFLKLKKFIGYPDILSYLEQDPPQSTQQQLIERIAQKTRQYAKRQHTFWRMLSDRLMPREGQLYTVTTEKVNLTTVDYDLYISHLLEQIKGCL